MLIYPRRGQPHLLLTLRPPTLAAHPGQVSLPVGAVEEGEDPPAAALREAKEEVGLDPSAVRLIGPLTPLHIPASGFVLQPIVALTDPRPRLSPAPDEVESLIEVPLAMLRDPNRLQCELWRLDGQLHEIRFYAVRGHRVWGATAMVLAEFLAVIQQS